MVGRRGEELWGEGAWSSEVGGVVSGGARWSGGVRGRGEWWSEVEW